MKIVEADFNCMAEDGSYWGIEQDDISVGEFVLLVNDKETAYPAIIVDSGLTQNGKPWLNAVVLVDR